MTLTEANLTLFARYGALIAATHDDPLADDARLSLHHLAWMCAEAQRQGAAMPADKASRWLGFIQGCLAMRGLIDVDDERAITRPLFHAAAQGRGEGTPATLVRPPDSPDPV